jgi:hypothetical protein
MDRRIFPTLLRNIRSLAQTVFKLKQKYDRSIEIEIFFDLEEGREVGERNGKEGKGRQRRVKEALAGPEF